MWRYLQEYFLLALTNIHESVRFDELPDIRELTGTSMRECQASMIVHGWP